MKTTVLVTGTKGQLGQCIQSIALNYPTLKFIFVGKEDLDITDIMQVQEFFKTNQANWCINCAAYTAVDNAEIHREEAYQVNVLGARNIAKACLQYNVKLIHISTDFVFDGLKNTPYRENDIAKPLGVYGMTKLESEHMIKKHCSSYFIIRTSWLYSEYGHNFMKTMLRLSDQRTFIRVVNDQIGSPTYAVDLAEMLMEIITKNSTNYGVFNYSNNGGISWFEFAKEILELNSCNVDIEPILSKDYHTFAKRPKYSVLDTTKIAQEFNFEIFYWKDSLIKALSRLNNHINLM